MYKNVALSLAFSILKNQDLAEDVLQEAFIKVFQKIEHFRSKSKFSTWLYRIVVNTSYNELKKKKKTMDVDDLVHMPDGLIAKEDFLKEETQNKYINIALARMNTDEALSLRLFYLSEMSIKEIKKITGFSTAKVKVCLHRGRSNLNFELKLLLGDELTDLL